MSPIALSDVDPEYKIASDTLKPNVVRDKMLRGELTWSLGLHTTLNPELALMAKVAGYDAVLMNLEHSKTGLESASAVCVAALSAGVVPIFVVPALTSDWISRSLDVGAQGIIVPRINTAEDARKLVKWAKYRPLGERPLADTPTQGYVAWEMNLKHVQDITNDRTLAMVMIETVAGLENVEEIAAVPGVDVLFVGTFDLSDEMGLIGEYDHPKVMGIFDKVSAAATKASINGRTVFVGAGGLEPRPDIMKKLAVKFPNIRYFMAGRDSAILMKGMRAQCQVMKDIEKDL